MIDGFFTPMHEITRRVRLPISVRYVPLRVDYSPDPGPFKVMWFRENEVEIVACSDAEMARAWYLQMIKWATEASASSST